MKTKSLYHRIPLALCGVALATIFSACGGGGSSADTTAPSTPAPPASTPTAPTPPAAPVTACAADAGSAFLGVNGHLTRKSGPYTVDFDTQIRRLKDLGVRNYRSDGAGSAEGLATLAAFADKANRNCITLLPIITTGFPTRLNSTDAYAKGRQYGEQAASALKGKVPEIELGNELDQYVKIKGNGQLPSDWDEAKLESLRYFLVGMKDGVKAVAPEMKVSYDNGIPLGYGLLKMLWDGTDTKGRTGYPVFQPDKIALHWYGSNGNIETINGVETNTPSLNLPQMLHDTYGVELEYTEFGGIDGPVYRADGTTSPRATEQAKADYLNKVVPEYYAEKAKAGVTKLYYYELYQSPPDPGKKPGYNFSLLNDDKATPNPAYDALKALAITYQ